MQDGNFSLSALSVLFFLAQTWGYHLHFRPIGRVTWALRGMSGAFILAFAAQLVALRTGHVLSGSAWMAAGLYLAAIALWTWAAVASGRRTLGLAFSKGDRPDRLISHGPYRLVRHPFYSSYLLYWLAGFVATLDLLVAASGVLAGALCVLAARREERMFASSQVADLYRQYQERTGMFAPRLR